MLYIYEKNVQKIQNFKKQVILQMSNYKINSIIWKKYIKNIKNDSVCLKTFYSINNVSIKNMEVFRIII